MCIRDRAKVAEPFDKGWESHERIAMVSWHSRIFSALVRPRGERASVKSMRPGAQWIGADDVVVEGLGLEISPAVVSFTQWGVYISNEAPLLRGLDGKGGHEDFSRPLVALTKPDEPSVDGVVFVPSEAGGVLVLSQSKACGLTKTGVGLASTTLNNGEVAAILVGMRASKESLVRTYPTLARAVVVYEVFSNKAELTWI